MLAIAFAVVLLSQSNGCTTCPKCPPEDAILMIEPGFPVKVKKGHFDDPENWAPVDEYEAWMDRLKKEAEEEEKDDPPDKKEL